MTFLFTTYIQSSKLLHKLFVLPVKDLADQLLYVKSRKKKCLSSATNNNNYNDDDDDDDDDDNEGLHVYKHMRCLSL